MWEWNQFLDIWRIYEVAQDAVGWDDGRNTIAFLEDARIEDVYGFRPESSVLAYAISPVAEVEDADGLCPLSSSGCPTYSEEVGVDIIFRAARDFTSDPEVSYRSMISGGDAYWLDQVLMHELGHAMGFLHEDRGPSLMNPYAYRYRNIGIMSDDVSGARSHYPAIATRTGDTALMGLVFDAGDYSGARLDPNDRVVRAGVDSVSFGSFTGFNRSAAARDLRFLVKVGGITVYSGSCSDVDAYGRCASRELRTVSVPSELYSGRYDVTAEIENPTGPITRDDVLLLGTLQVIGWEDQDRDDDGFTPVEGDCNDEDAGANPGRTELCDGFDNDCNNERDDDGFGGLLQESCYDGPARTRDVGLCRSGIMQCRRGDWEGCVGQVLPRTETCDGLDEDCDGEVDEGGVCGRDQEDCPDGVVMPGCDNDETIDDERPVDEWTDPDPDPEPGTDTTSDFLDNSGTSSDGGCAVAGRRGFGGSDGLGALLTAIALLVVRRRPRLAVRIADRTISPTV